MTGRDTPVVVIPAYRPGCALLELVSKLRSTAARVIVVDDGSGPAFAPVFDSLPDEVELLRHSCNLGKGAALRTAIGRALELYPDCSGIVTADADGQHTADDIASVARELQASPEALVMGARAVNQAGAPFRSRLGNSVSQKAAQILLGMRLTDTQTGLRGLPREFARHCLTLSASGYEFELDMLIAAKHAGLPIRELPASTIYIDGNRDSHFCPLRDSLKVGFVFLRFVLLALMTAALDNVVFGLSLSAGLAISGSQTVARLCAGALNYPIARRAVFLASEPHSLTLPRYGALVAVSGIASFALLTLFMRQFQFDLFWAKVTAESLLFPLNFLLLREFVFARKAHRSATDWEAYYASPFPAAQLTRRYTASVLGRVFRRFAPSAAKLGLVEFGGANSCFLQTILQSGRFSRYCAVDTSLHGLELLMERSAGAGTECRVETLHGSVLDRSLDLPAADVVLSVGLIEHFDRPGTRSAIEQHFRSCRPGGLVILAYPTPTLLYRTARLVAEAFHAWRFPDERPLAADEVRAEAERHGSLVYDRILWPLILTQRLMVFRR